MGSTMLLQSEPLTAAEREDSKSEIQYQPIMRYVLTLCTRISHAFSRVRKKRSTLSRRCESAHSILEGRSALGHE